MTRTVSQAPTPAEFEAFVREHRPILLRICRLYARSSAEFDDLYQEILIHLPVVALLVLFYRQQQETPFHEVWIYGFWLGLAIGLPIGITLFLRILDDINVLAKAVKELDE